MPKLNQLIIAVSVDIVFCYMCGKHINTCGVCPTIERHFEWKILRGVGPTCRLETDACRDVQELVLASPILTTGFDALSAAQDSLDNLMAAFNGYRPTQEELLAESWVSEPEDRVLGVLDCALEENMRARAQAHVMRTTLVMLQHNINQIGDEYMSQEGAITNHDGEVLDRWVKFRHKQDSL